MQFHNYELGSILIFMGTIIGVLFKISYKVGGLVNELITIRTNDLVHLRGDIHDLSDKFIEHLEQHGKH